MRWDDPYTRSSSPGPGPRRTSENPLHTKFVEFLFQAVRCINAPPEPVSDRNSTEAGDHRLASQLDGLGGAEYPSRRVFGSHGDVGLSGTRQEGSLEAVTGGRSHRL